MDNIVTSVSLKDYKGIIVTYSIDGQNLLSENYSYDHDDPQMCNVKVSLFVNGNTPLENRSLNFVVSKKEAEYRISLLKSEKAVINITE